MERLRAAGRAPGRISLRRRDEVVIAVPRRTAGNGGSGAAGFFGRTLFHVGPAEMNEFAVSV